MNVNLLITFVLLNIVNVVMQTVKSIVTVKSGKCVAALVNALTFALYTVVTIYTMCDLPMLWKALIVGLCNLVGVFFVKLFEEIARKDKLWKVEVTLKRQYAKTVCGLLDELNIPYNWIDMEKWYLLNIYCNTQKESKLVKDIVNKYNAKYFVSESKTL